MFNEGKKAHLGDELSEGKVVARLLALGIYFVYHNKSQVGVVTSVVSECSCKRVL